MPLQPDESSLPYAHLDTAALPGDAGFSTWRSAMAPIFDIEPLIPAAAASFRGGLTTHHLGTMLLGQTVSQPQHFRRTGRTIAYSGLDHFMVQLQMTGGYSARAEGRAFEVGPGDICVFDLTRPIETTTSDFSNLTFVVGRDMLAPLVADADALHGTVLTSQTSLGGLLADHLLSLTQRVPHMTMAESRSVADATAALIAGCLAPAAARRDETGRGVAGAVLNRIRRHIETGLASPELNADSIGRQFGLSRASLYRLFEPLGGVANYIRERRLARALSVVTGHEHRHRRIGEIAHMFGFEDETVFARAFKRAFALSPRDARSRADGVALGAIHAGLDREPELVRWLRGLAVGSA
ncbi:MAG: helix-turn-helix domain-containing protein [Rhodospirillales bacterium]